VVSCIKHLQDKSARERYGPLREEETIDWRKLHYELYSPPNIIWVLKSRRMCWAGDTAHIKGKRSVTCQAGTVGRQRYSSTHTQPWGYNRWVVTTGKEGGYPLYSRLGMHRGRFRRVWKISPAVVYKPLTIHTLASCYTNYTIPATCAAHIRWKGKCMCSFCLKT
jgi:hypothetical protein